MTVNTESHGGAVPMLTLGWRVKMAMGYAGVTREQLAEDLEVHPTSLTRWMNDRGAPPKRAFLKQIALRCGVSYDWLSTGLQVSGDPQDPEGTTMRRYVAVDFPPAVVIPLNRIATRRNDRDDVHLAG
jgi:transcriptional regulator with XRE-family HTH domain